jgi:hypothetical protein
MKYFKVFLLSVTLAGCATDILEKKDLQTAQVCKDSYLNLDQSWLNTSGVYLQKLKTTVQGKPFTFSVHLTLEKGKMEAIAFNDLLGRLYHLTWTPENISWEASEHIPNTLQPDYIIADFLLTHLPEDQLKTALKGAQLHQTGDSENNVREIKSHGEICRKIYRHKPLDALWKKVTLVNPEWKYELEIETVRLQ